MRSEFEIDDEMQRQVRDRLLIPFYTWLSGGWGPGRGGSFVFTDKGPWARELNTEYHIDTFVQMAEGTLVGIDEKIVRWKGKVYEKYALETMSCTVPGREKQGWMYTGKCDFILYCFVKESAAYIEAHLIPFKALQEWFFEGGRYLRYGPPWQSTQRNKSECYLTPIADVMKAVKGCRQYQWPEVPTVTLNNLSELIA